MAETSKTGTPKAAARKTEPGNGADALFPAHFAQLPVNFVQMQMRNVALMARANEILVGTARAVWENETELFKQETEHTRDSMASVKAGENPIAAFSSFCGQWHRNSERTIDRMRAIHDLVRNCEWQLLELVTDNMSVASRREAAE